MRIIRGRRIGKMKSLRVYRVGCKGKAKVKGKGVDVETSTLVNSGFEATEPQLIIPLNLAETLNLTSSEMDIEDFDVAGGSKISGYVLFFVAVFRWSNISFDVFATAKIFKIAFLPFTNHG